MKFPSRPTKIYAYQQRTEHAPRSSIFVSIRDSEAKVLEVLRYCFHCAIRIATGCILEVAEAVPVKAQKVSQRRQEQVTEGKCVQTVASQPRQL